MKKMKKVLIALLVITTLSATAQESVLLRLNYTKGDSFLVTTESNQSMGSQGGMNMKMTMGMIVADVVEESIKTESQITSIVIDMMQGGMTMSYDSNSDEELDQMGQMLKSQFAPMMEAVIYNTIDHQGNMIDTKLDPAIISQLQSMTFQGFNDLGQNYLDAVSKEIYENTLTGTSFAASVATIKQSVDASLGRYAKQALHDGLMQFDAAVNTRIALDAGATEFKYYGPDDEVTRDFCEKHVGKTYTKEEIEEIWSGQWAGKISGDPFVVRGGYNCRHRFRGVF